MAGEVYTLTGTPIVWRNSGGTYALTLASLASAASRQGAKGDLGATRAARYAVRVALAVNVAPANGAWIEVYLATSNSGTAGTDNTGAASGTNAAYTGSTGGGIAATKLQLQPVGFMPLTADASGVVQVWETTVAISERYVMPVLVNASGQALSSADHTFTLIPIYEQVQ